MISRKVKPAADAPLRLFATVHADAPDKPGGWHSVGSRRDGTSIEAVHAFTAEEHAWQWLLGMFPGDPGHETAMRLAWRVVELAPIAPPAAPRGTDDVDGPLEHVDLAPGVRAALRVTAAGDVVLLIPGGELTITAGAAQLGRGLIEASARAAEIRAEREGRRREHRAMDERARRRRGRR